MIRALNALDPIARRSTGRLLSTVRTWMRVVRERRALSNLDAHLLRDIGLTCRDAETEASRHFWDAPAHWHNRR